MILTSKCEMSKRLVKNCLKKLKVGDIVDCCQIDDDRHQFVVELSNNDGNLGIIYLWACKVKWHLLHIIELQSVETNAEQKKYVSRKSV